MKLLTDVLNQVADISISQTRNKLSVAVRPPVALAFRYDKPILDKAEIEKYVATLLAVIALSKHFAHKIMEMSQPVKIL